METKTLFRPLEIQSEINDLNKKGIDICMNALLGIIDQVNTLHKEVYELKLEVELLKLKKES